MDMLGVRRFTELITALFLLTYPLAVRALPGDLDPLFGVGGKVTFAPPYGSMLYDLVLQPDGKIIGVGRAAGGAAPQFLLARFLPTGELDPAFGSSGITLSNFDPNTDEVFSGALQPDGKIIVGGWSYHGGAADFAIARYDSNGQLDPQFGTGGVTFTSFGAQSFEYAEAIALQPDGRIVAAGWSNTNGKINMALARYLPSGSEDQSFGSGGRVQLALTTGEDMAKDVFVRADGRIIVAGKAGSNIALARLNPDGQLDASFGTGGRSIGPASNYGAYALAVQPDGKLVVADRDFKVARYSSNGALDVAFGVNGVAVAGPPGPQNWSTDVQVQPDGKIVLVGATAEAPFPSADYAVAVVRFNPDGSSDLSFGTAGMTVTSFGPGQDQAEAVIIQPDTKILVGGIASPDGQQLALARYLGDATCGNGTVEAGEECDDGHTGNGDCCSSKCQFEASTVTCRASAGACDLAENCTGSSANCPADIKSTALCRAAAGLCDVAESCNGTGNDCPADGFLPSSAECRASAGACDLAESCTGLSANCPADSKQPDSTSCSDGVFCNGSEQCQGGVCENGTAPCTLLCNEGGGTCETGCFSSPLTCRTADRSILFLKDKVFDGSDRLVWRWSNGEPTSQEEFGDPTGATDYALCLYAGPTSTLVGQSIIPASTTKWSALGAMGYRYTDVAAAEGGISKLILRGSAQTRSKALLKGKGTYLPDLPLPLGYPVTVQLVNGDTGLCWGADFTDAQLQRNETGLLKAKTP